MTTLNPTQKATLLRNLIRADHYDKMMYRRMMTGKLIGFYHPAEGAIAAGVGAGSLLNKDDFYNPSHRGHAIPGMLSKGVAIKYYLAEHTGKATGNNKGRSSWHWSFPEFKVFGMSGFIGHNFPLSVGWGWAAKRNGRRQVVMNASGDGSYGEGRAHEAMLMAANWKLPVVFFCENNGLAIHSTFAEMHPTPHIATLADGYGMPSKVIDGMDVFAVGEAVLEAIESCRGGAGPILIEAKTERFKEHDIGTPDLAGFTPRTKEQLQSLRARDPVKVGVERALVEGWVTQTEIDRLHEDAKAEVDDAERFADESPVARPTEQELMGAVYAA